MKLSRITKVNPREVWKHEAHDFTQWLVKKENIEILAEELELSLDNVIAEAAAGRYSVDLVADETDLKCKVIIENQLEATDHKHLGQILTYASAYDASVIIWVVTDYTEEHRQAIDWFNRNMHADISFFLVQVEVYRIGGSDAAPKFNVICEPNNWSKTVKSSVSGNVLSATKLLQMEFWEGLKSYASHRKMSVNLSRTPRPQHWFDIAIGSSKCHLTLTLNTQKERLGCDLYISDNSKLYQKLASKKDLIESQLGQELEWLELPEATASRILMLQDGNPKNRAEWETYYEWYCQQINAFYDTFKPYL